MAPKYASLTAPAVPAPTLPAPTSVLLDAESGEEFLSLAKASRHPLLCLDGAGRDPSTLWRWSKSGCRSATGQMIRLEVAKIGGTTVTTASAIGRFVRRLSGVDASAGTPTPGSARREHVAAEKQLDALGI